ncbi:MAG: AAA family ATPase, partial [Ignavibacteria bacterium]|nr:AAA family ATPase [Ignavibacteria bacterium]
MKFYFKGFIRNKLKNTKLSNAYLFLLWGIYKNLDSHEERYRSNFIKRELIELDLATANLSINREKIYRIIDNCQSGKTKKKNFDNRSEINSVQISNFRGFGSLEGMEDIGTKILLNRRKNIFYAPNGGGKSSLCEALEYILTKDIKEATRRRTSVAKYIKRGETRHKIQVEFAKSSVNQDSLTEIDNEYYKKSIIEKNRIQEFALLGCKDTKTEESDVIATVLGLEDLDNLISSLVQ